MEPDFNSTVLFKYNTTTWSWDCGEAFIYQLLFIRVFTAVIYPAAKYSTWPVQRSSEMPEPKTCKVGFFRANPKFTHTHTHTHTHPPNAAIPEANV